MRSSCGESSPVRSQPSRGLDWQSQIPRDLSFDDRYQGSHDWLNLRELELFVTSYALSNSHSKAVLFLTLNGQAVEMAVKLETGLSNEREFGCYDILDYPCDRCGRPYRREKAFRLLQSTSQKVAETV